MPNFGVQLALWMIGAVAGAVVLIKYLRVRELEYRLPAACQYLDLQARTDTTQAQLDELTKQLDEARKMIALRDSAVAEHEQVQRSLDDHRNQLLQVEGERKRQEELRQELASATEKLSQIQADRNRLDADSSSLKQLNSDLAERNRLAGEALQTATQNQRQLESDIQALGVRAAVTKERIAADEAKHQEITQRLADTQAELRKSEESRVASEQRKMTLDAEIRRFQTDVNQLNKTITDAKQLHEKLVEKCDVLQREIRTMEDVHQRLYDEEVELTKRRDLVAEVVTQLDREVTGKRQHLSEMEARVAELIVKEQALIRSIGTLEAIAKQLQGELEKSSVGSSEGKLRDLFRPMIESPLQIRSGKSGEQDRLQQTVTYLSDHGLHFPQRVVYAFHTALKTNRISPLVVLAGISGTGKSELPQRYAEAMGIHFVMLAVQPRWDSPHDLFGFYNYLERRYRATELSRALVQFERYNRKAWKLDVKQNPDLSDQMLLVLLDEMNLARVEYYFSDFLSKLEKRRGIADATITSQRTLAEIPLDMSSGESGDTSVRLFPDENVLFAGTMNEDESTQSLSDKVLDRASVLRFGKPPKMAGPVPIGKLPSPSSNGLSYDVWKSWTKPKLKGSDADNVANWIDRINNAMDRLQRPFGHRVAQAMASYVANYPSWVNDHLRVAMADQIELRIMPKLRGVDIEENQGTLQELRRLVREDLRDVLLAEAFDKGTQNQSSFIWRGLHR